MRKIFLLTLTLLLVFFLHAPNGKFFSEAQPKTNDTEFTDFESEELLQKSTPINWWENEKLTVEGYGRAPAKGSLQSKKISANRAAIIDGYRALAEAAGKVQITSNEFLTEKKVNAMVRGAKVISETYDEDGNCTVVLSVPIYGVTNSFAKAAFAPVDRKDFPAPTQNKIALGNYTGLIIDCGDMELNPVLSPAIFNAANESIYSYNYLDYEKVISKGMIGYAGKIFVPNSKEEVMLLKTNATKKFAQVGSNFLPAEAEESLTRAGSNPLVIKAVRLSDDDTCPMVSTEDADRILAENLSSHFLDEGAVVFTSNRIRGMRL